jgi:hypothetical protein
MNESDLPKSINSSAAPGWSGVDQSALFLSQVFAVPAPLPFAGSLDHFGSDRIEMNVANQFQKITISIAQYRLVAPFKQMPAPTVNFVKAPHVSGAQRLQDTRRRESIDLQQQMEVIRHQDIGVERERVALAHGPKRFDEGLVVTLPEENLPPVIATGDHVVKQSFGMNSRMARHRFCAS